MEMERTPRAEQTSRVREPRVEHEARRVHYEYSVSLPQLNLTLISILQGLAFGVLLSHIPLFPRPGESLVSFVLEQHLFLPFITSSLLILFIWLQFMHGARVIIWPVSTLQTGLVYLLTLTQIVTFNEIEHVPAWVAGLGFVGIVGGCHRLSNLLWHRRLDYLSTKPKRTWHVAQALDGGAYVVVGVLYVMLGLNYASVLGAIESVLPGVPLDPWAVQVLTLVVLCSAGVQDGHFRHRLLHELTGRSNMPVAGDEPPIFQPAADPARVSARP